MTISCSATGKIKHQFDFLWGFHNPSFPPKHWDYRHLSPLTLQGKTFENQNYWPMWKQYAVGRHYFWRAILMCSTLIRQGSVRSTCPQVLKSQTHISTQRPTQMEVNIKNTKYKIGLKRSSYKLKFSYFSYRMYLRMTWYSLWEKTSREHASRKRTRMRPDNGAQLCNPRTWDYPACGGRVNSSRSVSST